MPNIIFFTVDDAGREQFREMAMADPANPYPTLPNFTRLCQEGVLFSRAYSQPWCSPTRVKWHTGLMAYQSGVAQLTENNQPMLERFVTLPQALKLATDGEMRTACVGKWHMGNWASGGGELEHPIRCGYDFYTGTLRNLLFGENFYSFNAATARRTERGIKTDQKIVDEFYLEYCVREALEWVAESNDPFFLSFQSAVPHDPLFRPPSDWYDAARYGLPTKFILSGPTVTDTGLPYQPSYFKADLEAADHALGLLLQGLPQSVRSNTVVIFWADNGSPNGFSGSTWPANHYKQTVYEEGVNSAMAIAGPGVARGGRIRTHLVSSADLFQTCIDITGGTTVVPQTPGWTRQSISFWPACQIPTTLASARTYDIIDIFGPSGPNLNFTTKANRKLVNDRGWAIVRLNGTSSVGWPSPTGGARDNNFQLYNLNVDPHELTDLIGASSPFVSGGIINLTDADPTWGTALTNYNSLVALYATVGSAF